LTNKFCSTGDTARTRDALDSVFENSTSTVLEATPETDFNKQVARLRNRWSPERLNAPFDRIEDCRVDIEWMKRGEFEVCDVIARWRFVKV